MTTGEARTELEAIRRHPVVQPECTTCRRIAVLLRVIAEEEVS